MVTIKLPSKYILKKPMIGNPDYNESLDEYTANVLKYGVLPITKNGITTVDLVNDAEKDFDIDHVKMLRVIEGITITGFKTLSYFKIADLNDSIPDYLPNCMTNIVYDEQGEVLEDARLKTWKEWIKPNYTISNIEGFNYFLNYCNTGASLPLDIIIRLLDDGFDLVDLLPVVE